MKNVNERIKSKVMQIRASKGQATNKAPDSAEVLNQIQARVCAALNLNMDDQRVVAAVNSLNMDQLATIAPEQSAQITAGVQQVIVAMNSPAGAGECITVPAPDMAQLNDDEHLNAFSAALNNTLTSLLVGENHRSEAQIVAAINAVQADINEAFCSNDDLVDRIADAIPPVLNALDVNIEDDDDDDYDDDDINSICAKLNTMVIANSSDARKMAALASNLNALSNLCLANVCEKI